MAPMPGSMQTVHGALDLVESALKESLVTFATTTAAHTTLFSASSAAGVLTLHLAAAARLVAEIERSQRIMRLNGGRPELVSLVPAPGHRLS